jgi:Ca2+/Na+ antiporter
MDGVLHISFIFWKLAFAIVPPPHMANGYPCFFISLVMIGVVTAIVAEFATLLGCIIRIDAGITAITLVALGTSLPDTLASMAAA